MTEGLESTNYSKIKRLSQDELVSLWEKYLSNKVKETRDELIVQYLYLVRYVVGRIKVTLPATVSVDDITGYGVEGLINAVEKFSAQKNTRFETYALIRIRGAIIDRIRQEDFLPRSLRVKIKAIKNAQEELKQKLGRMPTTQEIAQAVNIDPDKIMKILSEDTTITSLYEKRGTADDSYEIIDTVQDTYKLNPQEKMEEKNVEEALQDALKRLPERERIVIVLYYQENMTMKEIGGTLNMSESRVCQIHAQGIMKLKNILSEERTQRLQQKIIA